MFYIDFNSNMLLIAKINRIGLTSVAYNISISQGYKIK